LGDVLATFRQALAALAALPSTRVANVSLAYRTHALMADPSEPPGPDYWNAAVELATTLSPHALLTRLHGIGRDAGRVRRRRWEARPLDLDLLFYDDVVIDDASLTLAHPHATSRIFVVAPLADIAPAREGRWTPIQRPCRGFRRQRAPRNTRRLVVSVGVSSRLFRFVATPPGRRVTT
jgi:2-amino-4-hydroxy-6-hydroxymethyldihydropteridine diphosphokinase